MVQSFVSSICIRQLQQSCNTGYCTQQDAKAKQARSRAAFFRQSTKKTRALEPTGAMVTVRNLPLSLCISETNAAQLKICKISHAAESCFGRQKSVRAESAAKPILRFYQLSASRAFYRSLAVRVCLAGTSVRQDQTQTQRCCNKSGLE